MLMYTIPEEKRQIRDELRKELLWSGFGSFSNGCWISPNDLEKEVRLLIEKYDIQAYADLFYPNIKDRKQTEHLLKKAGRFRKLKGNIKNSFRHTANKYIVHQSIMNNGKMTDAECFVERTNLVHEYRKFLFTDPGLTERAAAGSMEWQSCGLYSSNIINCLLNQQVVFSKTYSKKTMTCEQERQII